MIDYRKHKLKLTDEINLSGNEVLPVSEAIKKYTEVIDGMRDTGIVKLSGDALGYLLRMRNEKADNPTGNIEPISNKSIINSLFDKLDNRN